MDSFERKAEVLKVLGDKTRLQMVSYMYEQPMCVCEFVELFQMSQPSISQHIRRLKAIQLISETRKGQWIIYALNKESEAYQFMQPLIQEVPQIKDKLRELEEQGLRVMCD